jgi:dipeptidase
MVGNVSGNGHQYYVTGASNPCLSPFFPVFSPGTITPAGYLEGGADYSPQVYWWEAEKIHRRALHHFPAALKSAQHKIQEHERDMLQSIEEQHVTVNQAAIDSYFGRARKIVDEWGAELEAMPKIKHNWFFQRYWQGYHRLNGTG